MPWAGDTFTLQPWVPVENFINSLMATPDLQRSNSYLDRERSKPFKRSSAAIVDFDPFPREPVLPGRLRACLAS